MGKQQHQGWPWARCPACGLEVQVPPSTDTDIICKCGVGFPVILSPKSSEPKGKIPSDSELRELLKFKLWYFTIEGLLICKGVCNCSLTSGPLFEKPKLRPGRLKVMILKRQLHTAQVKVQEIIEKLVELQGVPRYLTDYEGDLCNRGSGQGFPICPFGNPDLVFPHCRLHMERMLQDERRD